MDRKGLGDRGKYIHYASFFKYSVAAKMPIASFISVHTHSLLTSPQASAMYGKGRNGIRQVSI